MFNTFVVFSLVRGAIVQTRKCTHPPWINTERDRNERNILIQMVFNKLNIWSLQLHVHF